MFNYAFDLISKSGDSISRGGGTTGSLGELGNSPSINDSGSIAFIGKFGTGFSAPTDLLFSDPLGNITDLSGENFGKFSNQVQINNNNQVVARDTVAGLYAIRRWDADLPSAYIVEATGGYPSGGLDFEWLYLFGV